MNYHFSVNRQHQNITSDAKQNGALAKSIEQRNSVMKGKDQSWTFVALNSASSHYITFGPNKLNLQTAYHQTLEVYSPRHVKTLGKFLGQTPNSFPDKINSGYTTNYCQQHIKHTDILAMYNKQQDIQGQIEEGPEHNYSLK